MNKVTQLSNSPMKFGEQLKHFRLEKNVSYEQIFVKTKIAEPFITSLERENFTQLPAYAYSRGLLSNLLECYGVAVQVRQELLEEFSVLYHQPPSPSPASSSVESDRKPMDIPSETQTKKQFRKNETHSSKDSHIIKKLPGDEVDADSPEKQLHKEISSNLRWVMVMILFVFLGLLFFFYNDFKIWLSASGQGGGIPVSQERKDSQGIYSLYNRYNTFDLVKDDLVKVFFNNQIYNFYLRGIDNTFDNKITANFDFNNQRLLRVYLFEEIWVDIDQDGREDILIKFQKVSGEVAIVFFSLVNEEVKNINYESIWSFQEKVTIPKGETVLLKDQSKIPIQVYVKATTLPVHLAYNIDGQRQNIVNLLPGNTVELLAHEHLELQIGNFRSVNLILNYMPLNFKVDNPNQFSIAKIIKWLPSFRNETKYDLIIKDYIE